MVNEVVSHLVNGSKAQQAVRQAAQAASDALAKEKAESQALAGSNEGLKGSGRK